VPFPLTELAYMYVALPVMTVLGPLMVLPYGSTGCDSEAKKPSIIVTDR
jgi:hypothetical protein